MFFCCPESRSKESYQIVQKSGVGKYSQVSYVNDIHTLDRNITEDKNVKIRPVRKSDYNLIKKQCQGTKFQDFTFPPDAESFGIVEGKQRCHWMRISEYLKDKNPVLFDETIQPKDVVHSNVGDCYLLSSIAALAENPQIIRTIFHQQKQNLEGIYKVVLSVHGVVQEVIVDDFIPFTFNAPHTPLFCQPTIKEKSSEFWTLILEKALAKIKGSYGNIMEGLPSEIFRAVTYCPAESLMLQESQKLEDREKEKEKIWNLMQVCSGYNEPFCATTKDTLHNYSGLTPLHTYTVIAVATLTIKEKDIGMQSKRSQERVVKLRNPWASPTDQGWKGRGSKGNTQFWKSVQSDKDSEFILKTTAAGEYGIFYMTFDQFYKNFNQIHYCNFHNNGKRVTQKLFAYKNHSSSFYKVNIVKKGLYTFQLNQSPISHQSKEQTQVEGICRASLILIAIAEGKLLYRGGAMKPNEEHLMLTLQLDPGQYILYANLDPTRDTNQYPDSATVNVYSSFIVKLVPVPPGEYEKELRENALREAFLNDGLKQEKKMLEGHRDMTVSYRLLFQQGGFGYIVFHNHQNSNKMFVVKCNQSQFHLEHLQLVHPAPNSNKKIDYRVLPGNDWIILAQAKKDKASSWKFPPPNIDIQLESYP